MTPSSDPQPTERHTILDMSQAELDQYISDLQQKRMLTRKRFEEAELVRKRVRDEKTRAEMETILRQMKKAMEAIDKHGATFEKKYGTFMTLKRMSEITGELDEGT